MNAFGKSLKELFSPGSDQHDWCDTTHLANPWSVLLGGRRRAPADAQAGETPDPPDLRTTAGGSPPAPTEDGRQ
jgi:hypothetical protein